MPLKVIVYKHPVPMLSIATGLHPTGRNLWIALQSTRQSERLKNDPNWGDFRCGDCSVITLRSLPEKLGANKKSFVSNTFVRLLTRESILDVISKNDYFGKVRQSQGFTPAVSNLIRELKQSCIFPSDLESAAIEARSEIDDTHFLLKTNEIVRIYSDLCNRLEMMDGADEDELIPQAIHALQTGHAHQVPSDLDVIGFYQFTRAQLSLLAALSNANVHVNVHINSDPEREFLFTSANRTIEQLISNDGAQRVEGGTQYSESGLALPTSNSKGPAMTTGSATSFRDPFIAHLENGLFREGARAEAAGTSVQVLESPGDMVEAEMVAVRLLRLHEEDGIAYKDMAIVVRSVGKHAARLRCAMRRYKIEMTTSTLDPLLANPAVKFLSRLAELITGPWARDILLEVLRSSYLGLGLSIGDRLEQKARREGVIDGPDRFIQLAESLNNAKLADFLARLKALKTELEQPAPFTHMVDRLCRFARLCLVGKSWNADDTPQSSANEIGFIPKQARLAQTDREALKCAYRVTNELSKARFPADGKNGPITVNEAIENILSLWETATYSAPHEKGDRVALLDAYDVTPAEFDTVFIVGLLEGSFPQHPSEDPFFRDDERQALARHGCVLLTALERADEERLLFYRAITAARSRIFLSYPRVTDEGKDCLRSFYLDEVSLLIGDLTRNTVSLTLSDFVPIPANTFNDRDRACAFAVAAGDWGRGAVGEFVERCQFYDQMHTEQPDLVSRTMDGCNRPAPFRLECEWRNQHQSYSVTDLETYVTCPYQYFAGRQLNLTVERDAPNQLDKGQILHAIARRFLSDLGTAPIPENADAMRQLEALLDDEIDKLRRDALYYQRSLLRLTLMNLLPSFLEREREYRGYTHLSPSQFELAFGNVKKSQKQGETMDPESTETPLIIDCGDAGELRLHGRLDRVDTTPDGSAAIIDYKLGSVRTLSDMQAAKSLQMPLYFMAMEQIFKKPVGAAFYDSFDKNERTVVLAMNDYIRKILKEMNRANGAILFPKKYQELVKIACEKVKTVAEGLQQQRIETTPGDYCSYCDFKDVCRIQTRPTLTPEEQ